MPPRFADNECMKYLLLKTIALSSLLCTAQLSLAAKSKPLYRLPDTPPQKKATSESATPFLVATDTGLVRILDNGAADVLLPDVRVERIMRTDERWYFLTDRGVMSSASLKKFVEKNEGLPYLTVKSFKDGQKSIERKAALLKDIAFDPFDHTIMVTATKDEVFLSRDSGKSWASIGSSSTRTAGIKAVAVCHMRTWDSAGDVAGTELVAFMSHTIYGFSYIRLDAANPKWVDVSSGFSAMPSMSQVDEIADILPVVCRDADGSLYADIYCSQTFLPNIFRFDWQGRKAVKVWQGDEPCDTIDALCQSGSHLVFSTPGRLMQLSLTDGTVEPLEGFDAWCDKLASAGPTVNAAYVPKEASGVGYPLQLGELWLLHPDAIRSDWAQAANNKKSLYASVYQLRNDAGIRKYRSLLSANKLNSIVIDMKDDYGLLRFEPESALLRQKGKVTQYKIDVDKVVSSFKADGVYLIARIVVFKDRNLASYDGGKYAVWNERTGSPWQGKRITEVQTDDGQTVQSVSLYDENWVDPYSEEVWQYNVEIARELVRRGFDEVQFDYIRFPTDGVNLAQAHYRWRDEGMDKESALVSFLSYARENIAAPIGIDIYGANGWYRSGTRTGQDVELMSEYVDIICPMFYPSHFEQSFLDYRPYEERAYRIYFYGSYRNTIIGRNRIIVRPWVQAFYMNVRHDRQYYDKTYVLREVFGVRDGVDRGYMYWNNSGGNYDDISPDPADDEVSPWHANESDLQRRLPAFSAPEPSSFQFNLEKQKAVADEMISLWHSVLQHRIETEEATVQQGQSLLYIDHHFGN